MARRRLRRWSILVLAGLLLAVPLLGWPAGRAAQQQPFPTPRGQLGGAPGLVTAPAGAQATEPAPTPTGDVPDAAECSLSPRSVDALRALAAAAATPVASPTAAPTRAPVYLPADPVTTQLIAITVRLAVVCANAGETLRLWSLFSDDYLRRSFARQPASIGEAQLRRLATPQPTRAEPVPVLRDVRTSLDRSHPRVIACLSHPNGEPVLAFSTASGPILVAFVPGGGGWLIDDVQPAPAGACG